MGEWSKMIGETGEGIAGHFLRMIGWGAAQHGVPLPCLHPEVHEKAGGGRGTHGIDFLTTRRSPLIDGVAQNLLISVKFSAEPYPASPSRIFKQHFTDLAHTLECFKNSEPRRRLGEVVRGVTRTQDLGVLLWFNNQRRGKADVISLIHRAILPDTLDYEAIYVVDNARAQFVFDSVHYARSLAMDSDFAFFYPDTGKNANPVTKETHGPFLPVEYINSSVLVFRIAEEAATRRTFLISTLEPFSEPGLKRLMGLAQSISQDWPSKVLLAFPDYDRLNHSNMVQSAKMCFSNSSFADAVDVHCYDQDFRTMSH